MHERPFRTTGSLWRLLWAPIMLTGCACPDPGPVSLCGGDAVMRYDPGIDRVVYFGRAGGPNVLHLDSDLYRPATAYPYHFRGGGYTWVAPQSQWLGPEGGARIWPPEPAADVGPMTVTRATNKAVSVIGPPLRRHIREQKTLTVCADGSAVVAITLLPAGPPGPRPAGKISAWHTTAAAPGTILAVPEGTVRFDNEQLAAAWKAHAVRHGPWRVLDTAKVAAKGKLFLNAPPIIAAWRKGQWFVRIGSDGRSARAADDAVIEIYLARDDGIIELEMIGPYRAVTADGANRWTETWRVVPAKTPTLDPIKAWLTSAQGR